MHIFNEYFNANTFCIFIDRQPHRYPENIPEQKWCLPEVTRATKYYHGQQQRSSCQPTKYSEQQQYYQNIKAPHSYSFKLYGSKKSEHRGNIHSAIPTSSIKYVPIIPNSPVT